MPAAIISWGCAFALYWQFYCNETAPAKAEGYEGFWLVDHRNESYPLHGAFTEYFVAMDSYFETYEGMHGVVPNPELARIYALQRLREAIVEARSRRGDASHRDFTP